MYGMLRRLGVALILCALVIEASGEDMSDRRNQQGWNLSADIAERFQAKTYIAASGDTIPYRFLPPEGYDSDQQYPLVLCLHGGAGRGRDNLRNIGGCKPARVLSEPDMRTRYPSFLLVPQAPPESSFGYAIDEETTADRDSRGRPTGEGIYKDIVALIQDVAVRWSVDSNRIYVAGQSMGGSGSWHLAVRHPNLFAAVLPITGAVSTPYADSLVGIPIWAFHGALDKSVPVQSTRDMVAAVNSAGGTARYTEFEGVGHNCWHQVFDDPEVLEWLFAQRRSEER
jgi:predicted peptidase